MNLITSLLLGACVLWLVIVAAMDLRIRRVRNWMVLLGLATGTAALFSGAQPLQVSAWSGLIGMLAAFAALLPFYALRWMGAGDVKFAAVIGLWFGLSPDLLVIWLVGSLLAGLHGLLLVLWRRLQHNPLWLWLQAWLPAPMAARLSPSGPSGTAAQRSGAAPAATAAARQPLRTIPYAGYLAIAALAVLWRSAPPLA